MVLRLWNWSCYFCRWYFRARCSVRRDRPRVITWRRTCGPTARLFLMLLSLTPSIFHREVNSAALNYSHARKPKRNTTKDKQKELMWCLWVAFLCSENAALWIHSWHRSLNTCTVIIFFSNTLQRKKKEHSFRKCIQRPKAKKYSKKRKNYTRKWLSECNCIADINFPTRCDDRHTSLKPRPNGILLLLLMFISSVSAFITQLICIVDKWDYPII